MIREELLMLKKMVSLSVGEKNLMLTGLTPESVQHLNTSKWSSVSSVANVSSVQLVLNT